MLLGKSFSGKCKAIIGFLIIVFAFSNCVDKDFDLSKVSEKMEYNPNLALTIGTIDLDIQNFLKSYDSTVLHTQSDGLMYILFEKDLKSYKGEEKIGFPAQDTVRIPALIFPSNYTSNTEYKDVSIQIPFEFDSNGQIDSVLLKTMRIDILGESHYYTCDRAELIIEFENVKKASQTLKFTIPISKANAGNSVPVNFNSDPQAAEGYMMKFNNVADGKADLTLRVGLRLYGTTGQAIDPAQDLKVNVKVSDITYHLVYGYAGQTQIMDQYDTVNLQFLNREIARNIVWKNPQIRFLLNNSYAAPIEMDIKNLELSQLGTNARVSIPTSATPKIIASPDRPYDAKKDSIVLDKNNTPALFSGLENAPNVLAYHLVGTCNPNGLINKNNIIMDTSRITGKFQIELPIYFKSAGFGQKDTMDFNMNLGENGGVSSMLFRIVSVNELPIDILLQLEFIDEKGKHVAYLFNNSASSDSRRIIKASTVDDKGSLVSSTNYLQDIVFNSDALKGLSKAKKIIYTTTMITSDNAVGKYVRFKSKYKLKMSFICQLQAHIEL